MPDRITPFLIALLLHHRFDAAQQIGLEISPGSPPPLELAADGIGIRHGRIVGFAVGGHRRCLDDARLGERGCRKQHQKRKWLPGAWRSLGAKGGERCRDGIQNFSVAASSRTRFLPSKR